MRISVGTILFADEDSGKLMLRGESDAFQEIRFGSRAIATVGNGHGAGFAKFAGEGDAGSVENLHGNRRGTGHNIMLVVSPVGQRPVTLAPRLGVRQIVTGAFRLLATTGLQIRAKYFIGAHANGQDDTKITIVGKGEIFAYLNAQGA